MDVKITILQVDVANLRPNTWNTNSVGAQNFEKLKGSIEKLGFFKPILARELEDGFFEILGGEHRWRAAIEQGISTVPVLSVGKISDVVAKQMSLVDNERYGEDDQIALQRFIEEIQSELDYQLSEIAPYDDEISMVLAKEAAIDLEALARQILWDDLQEVLPRKWVRKKNDTTMTIVLKNGSEIALKGADKPDTLRGVALHFVVLDEFQDMKADTWYKVLRPTLSSTRGGALIIGTPKGFSEFHKLWTIGQNVELQRKGQWKSWQFVTADSPFVPTAEIEAAKNDMDPKSFAQEYLASFENMSGRVYYPFDRNVHVKPLQFNPRLPIWVGQDFNIDPMSSVILQPQPNGELWAIDELVLFSSNTAEVCDELERRFWRWKSQVTVFPDPAGAYRQHARGESDVDIFKEKGFLRVDYSKKHPPIADRVNAVNRRAIRNR